MTNKRETGPTSMTSIPFVIEKTLDHCVHADGVIHFSTVHTRIQNR